MALLTASSAIQVIDQTPGTLVIVDPPYYALGWLFLVLGILFVGFAFIGKLFTSKLPVIWILLIPGVPFLLAGLSLAGSKTTTVLSAQNQSAVITTSRLGFPVRQNTLQLSSIQRALVETEGNSRRLVLLLRSGQTLPTNQNLSDRDGYYKAADAINAFINRSESGIDKH